ncbi:hypothetical protein F2Q69_00033706 [Brassica cretica]|uniref:Uncharacterized protein n=1 Tax=Brassica cretica TaxID=69181 RepID=A0A8S9SC74_BRACR|nr:hypothetical protein F2Q69_00033706 [Brassica cretica]
MMRQLHALYGDWLLKDGCWNFVVDHFKGARMFLSEGSTHADLVAMTQEDYNLDMNTESVELTIPDRITQRKRCTPKYIGRLFIDRVGIIDGLNLQHIKDAMKNMFGMTLDYTTSYRALLYAQEMIIPLQRQAWTPLDMEEDFVRRLPGSPDDFQEVKTTSRKSRRLSGSLDD